MMERSGAKFEQVSADILSTRYLAGKVGLPPPPQVARCLSTLEGAGLIWRSPYRKILSEGQRACHRYRPTYAGLAVARQAEQVPDRDHRDPGSEQESLSHQRLKPLPSRCNAAITKSGLRTPKEVGASSPSSMLLL